MAFALTLGQARRGIGSRLVEVRHFADCTDPLARVWFRGGLASLLRGTPSTNESTGFCTDESMKCCGRPIHRTYHKGLSAEPRFGKQPKLPKRFRPACWEETAVAKALPPSVAESDKVCLGDSRPGYGLRHGFFLMLLVALAFV